MNKSAKSHCRLSLLILLSLCLNFSYAQDEWQGVERIIAIGDIHGDYDNYMTVLKDAGIVNRRGNWVADETHFVQLGDIPDRGPDSYKIIEHMKRLEEQAEKAGGRVHALIGNHEAMNIYGDLRYVDPGEFRALRSRNASLLQDELYDGHVARRMEAEPEFRATADYREQFDALYPPGYVEHRIHWAPDGVLGSWVAGHNAIVKINRNLFVHGGISPSMLELSISEINDQVRTELNGNLPEEYGLSEKEDGPLWYRGLSSNEESLEAEHVQNVLDTYDVDRIIIGHTPMLGTIVPRFGAKVLLIDTGISAHYGGQLGSLLIEGNNPIAIQRGERLEVPEGGEELLPFFKSVLELEPDSGQLRMKVESLEEVNLLEISTDSAL